MGKRSRHAEMEREITELKSQLSQLSAPSQNSLQRSGSSYANTVPVDQWNGSHEAVAGLLDLRSGIDSSTGLARSPSGQLSTSKRIEDVTVSNERVAELFKESVRQPMLHLPAD